MKKGILIAVCVLFASVASSYAQAFFPTEKIAFYDQLSTYLNSSSSKHDREKSAVVMQAFRGVWDSYYDDQEANMVMRLCELLHDRTGGKAYANIFNYIEVVQQIPTAGLTHKDVNNWLCYTEAKTQNSLNGVDKYLASCHDIFVDKVLSAKGNSKWTLRDALWGFPSKERFELTVDGTLALVSQKDESLLKSTKGVYYLDGNRKVAQAVTEISHDIRTPLTAINSYLDLMKDEENEALKQEYLERIKSRTLSLSDLADELFKYSTSTDPTRYPVQSEEVSSEPIDICRTLEECILSFYAAFKGKGIEPEIELPDEPLYVLCDKKSANRIFENIISNAIKYANDSLCVRLNSDGTAVFSNPAPDLTPVSAAKLFDRYFTVKEGSNSTGLGFSIAKELIVRNGGTIESELIDGVLSIKVHFKMQETT